MISIIVPVYKVEKYLCRCIDSVLAQTYQDWELILVDDGSPDKSGDICDAWAKKDNRIRVFHKQNGGVSTARNLGLDEAKGEWIMFLDSDDMLTPHALQYCIEHTDGVQMVCCECQAVHEDGVTEFSYNRPVHDATALSSRDYAEKILTYNALCGPVCKLVCKPVIGADRFDESLHKGEDAQFLVKVLAHSDFMVYECSEVIYKYRILKQSLSHGNSQKQIGYIRDLIAYLQNRQQDADICHNNLSAPIAYAICYNIIEIVSEMGWNKQLSEEDYTLFVDSYQTYTKKIPAHPLHQKIAETPFTKVNSMLTKMYIPQNFKNLMKKVLR